LQTSHQRRHQELQPRSGHAPAHMLTALTRPVPSPVFSSPFFYSPSSAVSSVPQFHFLPRSSFLSSPALCFFFLSAFSPVSCVNSTRLHIRVFFRPFFQFLLFPFSPSAYLISVAVIPVPSTCPFPSRLWCKSRRNSDTYRNSDVILFPICPG